MPNIYEFYFKYYKIVIFYETYKDNEIVAPLVTQFSWTNNLLILSGTNSIEEKEFYIKMWIKNNYSKRELDRQEKKENENPNVGVILCASKDEKVVEYAMSRTMSTKITNIVEENNDK